MSILQGLNKKWRQGFSMSTQAKFVEFHRHLGQLERNKKDPAKNKLRPRDKMRIRMRWSSFGWGTFTSCSLRMRLRLRGSCS